WSPGSSGLPPSRSPWPAWASTTRFAVSPRSRWRSWRTSPPRPGPGARRCSPKPRQSRRTAPSPTRRPSARRAACAGRAPASAVAALQVAHDIPGRLRLRLPPGVQGAAVVEAMHGQPGVTECAWAPLTGSLLLRYRPDATTGAALLDAVAARTGLTPAPRNGNGGPRPAAAPRGGAAALAAAVTQGVAELNAGVGRMTGGVLDLRTLLPLVLAAWAFREIVRGQAGSLAWSSALWYAHGLFRDYSLPGAER